MRLPTMSAVALALMLMASACGSDSTDDLSSTVETPPSVEPGGVADGDVDIVPDDKGVGYYYLNDGDGNFTKTFIP